MLTSSTFPPCIPSSIIQDIEEYTEDYNPKWILKIQYSNNFEEVEKLLNEILSIHAAELERIIPLIHEEDYAE